MSTSEKEGVEALCPMDEVDAPAPLVCDIII